MTPLALTSWETYSPLGHGHQAHLAGLAAADGGAGPRTAVAGFEVRQVLGRTGTRAMDRAAGLAVATTRRLLERLGDPDARFGPYPGDEVGLVLGTSDGTRSVMEFLRDTWTRDKPYDVDPSHVPRTLMNFAAGQCAIWHGIRGPNATICGAHATGLLALNYARRLHHNGHAAAVLWGAVEELSAERAAVEAARSDAPGAPPPSEGCVMFLLEPAESPGSGLAPLAEVLAVEFGVWTGPDRVGDALAACLRRALTRAAADPEQVLAVAPAPRHAPGGLPQQAAVSAVLGDRVRILTASLDAVGDARAVSTAYQIVELLAQLASTGGIGAVTAVDQEGRVGCALLRIR